MTRTVLVAALAAIGVAAPTAHAVNYASGGKTTIHKKLRVGTQTVHWSSKPVPDQSTSDIQIRVAGRTLLIQPDSICSGLATWRDFVIRVDACGKGASPLTFSAVRLNANRVLTVRLRIVVTAP
jgi:hypothetical protein